MSGFRVEVWDEGDECPDCGIGTLQHEPEGQCTCFRSAPCWACVEAVLTCDVCGAQPTLEQEA